MLRQLVELHARLRSEGKALPTMYEVRRVDVEIELTPDGKMIGSPHFFTDDKEAKAGRFAIPARARSGTGENPFLVVDTGEYVFGFSRGGKSERKHNAYLNLLDGLLERYDDARVRAVRRFAGNGAAALRDVSWPQGLEPAKAWFVFRVDDAYVHELDCVKRFWAESMREAFTGPERICLVCGEKKEVIARGAPVRVKRVSSDGQASGAALITADKEAFESYGQEQSLVAANCFECSTASAEALNWLITADEALDHRLWTGQNTIVFWLRDGGGFDPLKNIASPQPQQVRRLITAAHRGQGDSASGVSQSEFYLTTLTNNAARLVVQDWIETSISEIERQLGRWFDDLGLEPDWPDREQIWPRLGTLVEAINPPGSSSAQAKRDEATLLRAVFRGARPDPGMVARALERQRAEIFAKNDHNQRSRRHARAALLKLFLRRDLHPAAMPTENLNPENPSVAYQCGRMLAVIEGIQRAGMGGQAPGASVIDRYYGAASTTPSSVLGVLIRESQSHLAKLRRERTGLGRYFEKQLEEISGRIEEIPATLSLREQAEFALGYYQQRAYRQTSDDEAPGNAGSASDQTPTEEESPA